MGDVLHVIAQIGAVILLLEVILLVLVPIALIGYFGSKGLGWVTTQVKWGAEKAHQAVKIGNNVVDKAENVIAWPVIQGKSLGNGLVTTIGSLRRRASQPLLPASRIATQALPAATPPLLDDK